jgi:hypothetical protein
MNENRLKDIENHIHDNESRFIDTSSKNIAYQLNILDEYVIADAIQRLSGAAIEDIMQICEMILRRRGKN